MRCPECGHTQKKSDGNICKKCRYRFVLMPKEDPIHDYKLKGVVNRLSANGRYSFTRTQLLTEMVRTIQSPPFTLVWILAMTLMALGFGWGAFTAFTADSSLDGIVPGLLFGTLALVFIWRVIRSIRSRASTAPASLSYGKAGRLLHRYLQYHSIPGLVDGKALENGGASLEALEGHAPEAILVVERNDLVDALIKNRFHMEHKTAVVSKNGYPQHVFAALSGFVAAYPTIPIYVAHDASQSAAQLVQALSRKPKWAFAAQNLKDAGLSLASLTGSTNRLPWIDPQGKLVWSREHQKQFDRGARLPIDSFRPRALTGLTAAAIAAGGILTLAAAADSRRADGGGDFG
jgi:hypothetical protein